MRRNLRDPTAFEGIMRHRDAVDTTLNKPFAQAVPWLQLRLNFAIASNSDDYCMLKLVADFKSLILENMPKVGATAGLSDTSCRAAKVRTQGDQKQRSSGAVACLDRLNASIHSKWPRYSRAIATSSRGWASGVFLRRRDFLPGALARFRRAGEQALFGFIDYAERGPASSYQDWTIRHRHRFAGIRHLGGRETVRSAVADILNPDLSIEPLRVCRRLFSSNHAAMSDCSSAA